MKRLIAIVWLSIIVLAIIGAAVYLGLHYPVVRSLVVLLGIGGLIGISIGWSIDIIFRGES